MNKLTKISTLAVAALVFSSTAALASPANQKGVTWTKKAHDTAKGVDTVGCKTGSVECDPYKGDMSCAIALPILCINQSGAALPQGLDNSDRYNKWAKGHISHTAPIKGSDISSTGEANMICENTLGKGYRMASHHDGWGWNFRAYGNVRGDTRYWVTVKDQANAHCW